MAAQAIGGYLILTVETALARAPSGEIEMETEIELDSGFTAVETLTTLHQKRTNDSVELPPLAA